MSRLRNGEIYLNLKMLHIYLFINKFVLQVQSYQTDNRSEEACLCEGGTMLQQWELVKNKFSIRQTSTVDRVWWCPEVAAQGVTT